MLSLNGTVDLSKCIVTPTKRSGAQPLVEREKQFECRPVENALS